MKLAIGISGLLLASLGCGDEDMAPTSSSLDRLNVQGFPLAVGNNWVYELNGSIAPPDSSSDFNYTRKVAADWEIVAKDTVLGQEAFHFETTHHFPEGPDEGQVSTQLQDGKLSVSCPPASLTVLRCELDR